MANKLPVDTLYHATLVTKDARTLARNHAQFFGINRWKVVNHTPTRLSNMTFRSRGPTPVPNLDLAGDVPAPGEYRFISATGTSDNGGISFNIIQPTGGLNTFEHFLVTRGQGIHGIFMSVVQQHDFDDLKEFLSGEGVEVAQSYTVDDAADHYFFDTRAALGGYYVEVVVPRRTDWREAIAADDEWDFSDEVSRPTAVTPVAEVRGIPHFGVVVPDVVEHVERYAKLFRQPLWRGMHWRTEPGWLEETTYNGSPVEHAYFTGRGDVGKTPLDVNFGFEIVQPTFGPSHYKEDFLHKIGPGIHHVDLTMPIADWDQWEAINRWLAEDMESPTCMSGWLRGKAALFQYQDTRKKLGYVIEIHAPRPSDRPMKRWAPDYWYDFTPQLGN